MMINGDRLDYPDETTCPDDAVEREAWEFFTVQLSNVLQISLDFCTSKFIFKNQKSRQPNFTIRLLIKFVFSGFV